MSTATDGPDLPNQVHAEQTHLIVPSRPYWIESTADFLRQKAVLCGACQDSHSRRLLVALHEALSNAIIHGNLELSSELKERDDSSFAEALAQRAADPELADRVVDILVDYDGERCCWIVTDQGQGFNLERVLAGVDHYDPKEMLSSGRGILLMRSFVDEVRYEAGGRRVILTLRRSSGAEKRSQPRVACRQRLWVAPIRPDGSVDWDSAYDAISHNLSVDGLALLQQQLTTSERVLIGINSDQETFYIPAEVRHWRVLGTGLVELGCHFQTSKAVEKTGDELAEPNAAALAKVEAALAALVDSHQPVPIDHERRQHPRVIFNDRLEVLIPTSPTAIVGYTRDLSKGGVAFITTAMIHGVVSIAMAPRSGGGPLRLRAHIVRCTEIETGFFDVAARFLGLEENES